MPSFQISDPPTRPTLADATEGGKPLSRGTVSFVVENLTPVRRIAVAKVVAEAAGDPGIYVLAGSSPTLPTVASIDFEPNQSQTIQVSITVPRGAAPRQGGFHLHVAKDGEDSDADSVDSRPVAYEVPAAPPPPLPPQPFPWWAVIVGIVLLLVIGGGAWYLLSPKPVSLDQINALVVGKPIDDAVTALQGQNLTPVRQVARKDGSTPADVNEASIDPANAKTVYLSYDPGLASLLKKPSADAKKIVTDQWKLAEQDKPDPAASGDPNLISTVDVSGTPGAQTIVLSFDPGINVPKLVGASTSTMVQTFGSLANKATATILPPTPDNPNACGDSITTQQPLNNSGLYKTGTQFFFHMEHGTKSQGCLIVFFPPLADAIRDHPNILLRNN